MLHYNTRHVSSINMPIFRRTNYIITASGNCSAVCSHPAYCAAFYRQRRYQILYTQHLVCARLAWHVPDAVLTVLELLMMGEETVRNM